MTIAASPRRVYYWAHHTGSWNGNTGVQRTVRGLGAALTGVDLIAVRWCGETESIVRAGGEWLERLGQFNGPRLETPLEPDRPLHLCAGDADRMEGAWLLLGEVPHVGNAPSRILLLALDYARYYGMRIAAVFYDLVPIRVPGYEDMRDAHILYAEALATVDLVLPISRASGAELQAYWLERGIDPDRLPPVRPVPLPAEMAGAPRAVASPPATGALDRPVRLLAIGTVEPRKNQAALLQAVNRLRARRPGLAFTLDVVGNVSANVAAAVQHEVSVAGGHIRLRGYLSDEATRGLLQDCDATVFVSLAEGYGLPVTESLWAGKPCLCSDSGAIAEVAQGGGCLMVDPHSLDAIERGLERIVSDAPLRAGLARQALDRPLARWSDYARKVLAELEAAPALQVLVVIEGSLGGGQDLAAALESGAARVRRLHWRARNKCILPGFRGAGDAGFGIGSGNLQGLWAVVPVASTLDTAEAMALQDAAHGLGMKVAMAFGPGHLPSETDLPLVDQADLVLHPSDAARQAALDLALCQSNRTATLRSRFHTAVGAPGIIDAVFRRRKRLTVATAPLRITRVFYFVGLTVTQPFNTGVQRLTRTLARFLVDLGIEVVAVKWDEAAGRLATIEAAEAAHLAKWAGPTAGPQTALPQDLSGEWLVIPEITVPSRPEGSNIALQAKRLGMRVAAVFYDLIPLKMAELYPPAMLPAFLEYWALFAEVDLALPISWTMAGELLGFLAERGMRVPPIVVCPLAGDLPGVQRQVEPLQSDPAMPLRLVAIGTLEPRKNYPRLIRAVIAARARLPGRDIELTIVGRRAEFHDLTAEIHALADQAGGIFLPEYVSDDALASILNNADATLFGSWEEGFGLPVLESAWRGLPCLCHDGSALAEVATGGGELIVDMLDDAAVAEGVARLASEPGLLDRLRAEAVRRPIRNWRDYALDVLAALSFIGAAPGWPRPAVLPAARSPLLTCAITTYNREHWLQHTLPQLIAAARPFGCDVEVVVCDNTSTDSTPDLVQRFAGTPNFVSRRNAANVGMLGNLGATTRAASGAFVWILGDDDLIVDGAIEAVLHGLDTHRDVEMAYLNYAYTSFAAPTSITSPDEIVRGAIPLGHGGPNRRVDALREVAAFNENLFTAIYTCVFRRDHALRCYQQDSSGPPFSSLLRCIPSSVYALAALADRPAWWVGQPAVVVNSNVSWLRWELLWRLERMPDLYDAAELAGVDPVRVDRHRVRHAWNTPAWTRTALMEAEEAIRTGVSVGQLIERCKHLDVFKADLPQLWEVYSAAYASGRVLADHEAPAALFERYGLHSPV